MPIENNSKVINSELLGQLRAIAMPGNSLWVNADSGWLYEAAYKFWYAMVEEGMRSEGIIEAEQLIQSDDFIRQHEIYCLVCDNEPVGLFAFSWLDLSFTATRQQQYFSRNYPSSILDFLQKQENPLIMTMGQLTVHPQWRKNKIGPGISEILVGFAVNRLLTSPADICLSFARNNRKTNILAYGYGAKLLVQNYKAYGIASDILALYRDQVSQSPIVGIAAIVDHLWSERITIGFIPKIVDKGTLTV